MEKLIKTILVNNGYETLILNDEINGFHLGDKSYFFLQTIGADELKEIKNKSSLQDCTWYRVFLSKFKDICQSNNYPPLEKNSAMLILVDSSSVSEMERLQSQILLIEEDQYFIKKYVIVYTPNSLSKISELSSNEQLQEAINNSTSFQSLLENGINDNIADYILLLQLFIKLPFLKLKFEEENFVSLPEKIQNVLGNNMSIYEQIQNSIEEFKGINFLTPESDTEIDTLLTLLANDSN